MQTEWSGSWRGELTRCCVVKGDSMSEDTALPLPLAACMGRTEASCFWRKGKASSHVNILDFRPLRNPAWVHLLFKNKSPGDTGINPCNCPNRYNIHEFLNMLLFPRSSFWWVCSFDILGNCIGEISLVCRVLVLLHVINLMIPERCQGSQCLGRIPEWSIRAVGMSFLLLCNTNLLCLILLGFDDSQGEDQKEDVSPSLSWCLTSVQEHPCSLTSWPMSLSWGTSAAHLMHHLEKGHEPSPAHHQFL